MVLKVAERDTASLAESATEVRPAMAGDGRRWPAVSLLLVAVFVLGFVLVSSVALVRGRMLDPDLYSSALVRTDAYERVYTEVLADPAFAELQEELLGGLGIDEASATQVRTLATSSLRLGLPPSTLRRGTETFIASASGRRQPAGEVPVTTEDYGSVLLRFKGGARGCFTVSQVMAGRKNSLRLDVAGSEAALAWDSEEPNVLRVGQRERANERVARDPTLLAPAARPFAVKTMILMTDGIHNQGPEPVLSAREAAKKDIVIHTITFSSDADIKRMQDVAAAAGGQHFHAPDAQELVRIFKHIASTLPVLLTE